MTGIARPFMIWQTHHSKTVCEHTHSHTHAHPSLRLVGKCRNYQNPAYCDWPKWWQCSASRFGRCVFSSFSTVPPPWVRRCSKFSFSTCANRWAWCVQTDEQTYLCHLHTVWCNKSISRPMESSTEKQLIQTLIGRYQALGKLGRPVKNSSESVMVKFGLGVITMSVREMESILSLSVWTKLVRFLLKCRILPFNIFFCGKPIQRLLNFTWFDCLFRTWKDEYLVWNPLNFGNLTEVTLPLDNIWTPDFTLYST